MRLPQSFAASRGVPALLSLAAWASLAAGCSEGTITDLRTPRPSDPHPGYAIAEVVCTATPKSGTVQCGGNTASDRINDWIVGGQNVNLRLASTNVAYDTITEIFSADVTVQNLRLEKYGSDAADTTGIFVFFHQAATAVTGSGTITVNNADGAAAFTDANQPYFHYPEVIGYQQTTAARTWEWNVPRSVQTFQFRVLVSTRVMPVVVFDFTSGGNPDIYRVALDGSDLIRLTTDAAPDADPSAGPGVVVFWSTRDSTSELFKLDPFTGVQTQLTFTTGITHEAPAVSSDGSRIAYGRAIGGGLMRLRVMNINGGDTAAIAGANGAVDTNPSWKPSSDSLVFMSAGGFADSNAGLYRTRTGSAAATGLVAGPTVDIDPAWSPDGRYIAFSSPRAGSDDLYLIDLVTMATTPLTSTAGGEFSPAWTSDGRIVFVRNDGGVKQLHWLDPSNPTVTHPIPGTVVIGQQRLNHAVFPF